MVYSNEGYPPVRQQQFLEVEDRPLPARLQEEPKRRPAVSLRRAQPVAGIGGQYEGGEKEGLIREKERTEGKEEQNRRILIVFMQCGVLIICIKSQ